MAAMFTNCRLTRTNFLLEALLFTHKNVKKVMTNHNNSYLFVCALCISYYNHTLSGESSITTRLKTRSK